MADGMTAAQATTLYDRDFYDWTRDQAAALRAAAEGDVGTLDWLNLAEEIESLGNRDVREVWSRMGTIIEHLLKLEVSPASAPREGWAVTVLRNRAELDDIFEQSPSLRRRAPERLERQMELAAREAAAGLHAHGEDPAAVHARLAAGGYTAEQVLGDWWPEGGAPKG